MRGWRSAAADSVRQRITARPGAGRGRTALVVVAMGAASIVLSPTSSATVQAEATCLTEAGWHVCYETTPTDGLRVSGATYLDRPALASGSIPQIDVDYDGFTLLDELGSRMIPATEAVVVRRDAAGFELAQSFQMTYWPQCSSYRYDVSWRFLTGGQVEPSVTIFGPGMEGPHTYHVYWRLEVTPGPSGGDDFTFWDGDWRRPPREGQFDVQPPTDPGGDKWRVLDSGSGWALRPATELQAAHGWVLRKTDGQGDIDLPAQRLVDFPNQWVDGEPIQDQPLVLWYRMSVHKPTNCDRAMRVTSGPQLVPVSVATAVPPTPTIAPHTPTPMPPTPTAVLPTPGPTAPGALTVRGHVDVQGRMNDAGVIVAVDGTPWAVSNADGSFELAGMTAGDVVLRADLGGYLCAEGRFEASPSMPLLSRSVLLQGGDVVRDRRVDLFDLVAVSSEYGNPAPTGSRADINADGTVNLFDLVLVVSNYGIACPTGW